MIYVANDEVIGPQGLTFKQRLLKRSFDVIASLTGLIIFGPIILLAAIAATINTGKSGLFLQTRIGRYGKPFKVVKLRTMRVSNTITTTVTTKNDPRITTLGRFFRRSKIDELPQLFNVLIGQMSFVGPRPDVPGFADTLEGEERIILTVRPGITGPATLKYRDEEEMLAGQEDPERFNREVIFVDKVALNKAYVENYSFAKDITYIMQTALGRASNDKEQASNSNHLS